MPLYRKAKAITEKDIEVMTFNECYELLLIFRYLQFREDNTLSTELIKERMAQLSKRMQALDPVIANSYI